MIAAGSVKGHSPWTWIPSLYFAEGMPYAVVMMVSVIVYKRMGMSNADVALFTGMLYLPWVIKPLWSPFVDLWFRKRNWITNVQLLIAVLFGTIAFLLPTPFFFSTTLAVMWVIAFASATHDIAADGFYILSLSDRNRAAFIGVQSTAYKIAMLAGQGGLVILAGVLEANMGGRVADAWARTFGALAVMFLCVALYHRIVLPRPLADGQEQQTETGSTVLKGIREVFGSYFKRPHIAGILAFLTLYRLGEAQLLKMVQPFLLDGRSVGGLGLTTSDVGLVYGTIGVSAFLVGGILGGYAIARGGLRRWFWPMVVALHIPDLVFVYLSHVQPGSLSIVGVCVSLEQFGYGFGATAFVFSMIRVSQGPHATAHYAISTGFMALGMMLPGMMSGAIQQIVGYKVFFLWVIASTIPSFLACAFVRIPEQA